MTIDSNSGPSPLNSKRNKRSFQAKYYLAYFTIYIILIVTNWVFLVDQSNPLSIVLFATMAFLFFGMAYNVMDLICFFTVKDDDLARLRVLPMERKPKIAVLYCTYNDFDNDCLVKAGRQDYPVDVFVLDDSTDCAKRAAIDKISSEQGYRVIRRDQRAGFKAGALNNWLRAHGKGYEYIAVLDADSLLPIDFVRRSLLFAEHPSNRDVSIFQAKVNIYNKNTMFTSLMSLSPVLWYPSYIKLVNRLDWMMCWGHNNLLRVSHLQKVGGWDEKHVSEDFALAMELRRSGHGSVLTPIDTYEACPPDFEAYKSRACRWAKGTLKCFSYLGVGEVPLSTRFMLFLTGWCTMAFFGYLTALVLMVYGFTSSYAAIINITTTLSRDISDWLSSPGALILVMFYFLFLIFGRMVLIRRNSSNYREYMAHIGLGLSINMMLTVPMVYHQLLVLFGRKVSFKVTPKEASDQRIPNFLFENAGHLVLTSILVGGALLYNPLALVHNVFWIAMMILAPFLIWRWQNRPSVSVASGAKSRNVSAAINIAVVQKAFTK